MSAMADTGKKTSTDKTKDARQSGNGAGALIITGSGRFFSNGLDYGSAMKNKRFFEGERPVLKLVVEHLPCAFCCELKRFELS